MYFAIVVSLMLVFPLTSIAIQILSGGPGALTGALVAKWFVFWMVGARLLVAGLRQIVQPRYTAEHILGIEDSSATLIVRELGFANTAIGSIGIASLFFRSWQFPIALLGAIFYALAGINHLTDDQRNKLQGFAMVSDLFAAAVLLVSCLAAGAVFAGDFRT
jgi:hypothetical protein